MYDLPAPVVSNIRARQRDGTKMVDIYYNLSDADSHRLTVGMTVSTNDGISYNLLATSIASGAANTPSIGSGVSPGHNRWIVWNAGTDWNGQISRKVRFRVTASDGNTTHALPSGRVEVDTRTVDTYTISGRLLMGGNPVANAEVFLVDTAYRAISDAAGYFAITNVPPGYKYTLVAAAPGTDFLRQIEIDVVNAAVELGDLLLAVLTGPYKLVPLSPDVNPAVSEVETDGVLFRHYQVLTQNGNLPAPLASFTVKRQDGTVVPQLNVAEVAFGYASGTADWTGLLRIRVPGDYLTVGSNQWFDILEGTSVRASFYAKAKPIEYDLIWKIKSGASIRGMVETIAVDLGGGAESTITETIRAGEGATKEQIRNAISSDLKLGLEASQGVKMTGPYFKAGAGAKAGGKCGKTYEFDPDTMDPVENALKFYAVTAPFFKLALAQQPVVMLFVETQVEPFIMGDHLVSVQGEMGVGTYADVQGNLGLTGVGDAVLGLQAKFKAEALATVEHKFVLLPASESGNETSLGMKVKTTGSAGLGLHFGAEAMDAILGKDHMLGWGLRGSLAMGTKGTVWWDGQGPRKIGLSSDVEMTGGLWDAIKIPSFSGNLNGNAVVGLKGKMLYDFRGGNAPGFWSDFWAGKVPVDEQFAGRIIDGIGQSLVSDWAQGEMRLYVGERVTLEIDLDASATVAGAGIGVSGELERGAERVILRNRVLRMSSYPIELYPGELRHFSVDMVDANQKIADYAAATGNQFKQALNQTIQAIAAGVDSTVEVVGNGVQGALDLASGTLAAGTEVVGSILAGGATGGHTSRMALRTLGADVLPPAGASNYVYGVSGILSFASSNELTGAATLRLSYTDEQVEGLNEADLRIFRFNNASADWTLIGGTVDAESNVVTAAITELGTFALAPPLPKGPLSWSLSADTLAADGASVITAQVANITLNTGELATNAWRFTVLENNGVVLNEDGDTNAPGIQVASSNAALEIAVRAPNGGVEASVTILCDAGGASATVPIPLVDDGAPPAPSGLTLTGGQSRLFVSWASNAASDAVSCKVYYRKGAAGPPYDGMAAVEGRHSPAIFPTSATNATLRGLDKGATYYASVSAVDGSGNESALVDAGSATTSEQPPMPPTGVAATLGEDGTNLLMWALSEDDGFNDRDVVRYEVYRAVLPGGEYQKVGETPAGVGLFVEAAPAVLPDQYVRYAVKAIDAEALSSEPEQSSHVLPGSWGTDNDWDGIDDDWETRNGLDPLNRLDADLDDDEDGYTNRQEYEAGTDPQDETSFLVIQDVKDAEVGPALLWLSSPDRLYSVNLSTNLKTGFSPVETVLPATPPTNVWSVPGNATQLYYRIGVKRQ